jgi:hypothetical protein
MRGEENAFDDAMMRMYVGIKGIFILFAMVPESTGTRRSLFFHGHWYTLFPRLMTGV